MSQHYSAIDMFPEYDEKGFFSETPTETSGHPTPKGKPIIDNSKNRRADIPEPWLSGDSSKYAVPKNGDPWEKCVKKVKDFDSDMCERWREEVDNLLIYAGLYSSVLTAFVIESYQSLHQDPNDTNTFLLQQILLQVHNGNSQSPIPSLPPFSPSPTDIRVNVFWFTSLSLSLATVLIGILCMQWLREYRSYQANAPLEPQGAISLRQLRHEGLMAWKVPDILMLLPVLLHFSLVLFFLGLVDLLWSINHTVAFFVSIVSGVLLAFLLATSSLPALQLFFINDNALRKPQCAYKSPQSWAFQRMITWLVWYSGRGIRLGKKAPFWLVRYQQFMEDKNWVDHDMRWREARDRGRDSSKLDVVQALAWIDRDLGQTVDMIYAVYHCIRGLPSVYSRQVVSQICKKAEVHLSSEKMVTYLGSTTEEERCETMAALFLEVNTRAYPQLDQYQVESVVRILNTRLHDRVKEDVPISESLPFVKWPVHIRMLPADLMSQFLLCIKHLVQRRQLPQEQEDETWTIIQRILDNASTHSAHHQHTQLALEIMEAFESNLPTIGKSDDDDVNISDARKQVKECAGHIIRALSQGGLGDLEPRARKIVSAIRNRMDSVGGMSLVLPTEDQRRWDMTVKGVSWDDN